MYSSLLNDSVALLTWHLRFRSQFQSGQMQSCLKRRLFPCWASIYTTLTLSEGHLIKCCLWGSLCCFSALIPTHSLKMSRRVSCMQDAHLLGDPREKTCTYMNTLEPGAATVHATSANSPNCPVTTGFLLPSLRLWHPAVGYISEMTVKYRGAYSVCIKCEERNVKLLNCY